MGAVWLTMRAEWRERWRALLALAAIAGVAGAVAVGAVAASRRVDTAFQRLLDHTHTPNVFIQTGEFPDPGLVERAARLPGVEAAALIAFLVAAPDHPEFRSLDTIAMAIPTMAGRERWRERIVVGREADPHDPGELVVNEALRDALGAKVGDRLRLVSLTPAQASRLFQGGEPGPPGGPSQAVTLVGVTRTARDVSDAPEPTFSVTPAFYGRYADQIGRVELVALRVDEQHLTTIAADVRALFGSDAVVNPPDDLEARIEDSLDVQVLALRVFAVAATLAGLVAVGQALARQAAAQAVQHDVRRALGMTTRQLVAAGVGTAVPAAVAAAAVAACGAVAGGPLAVTGIARVAEPDPGPWLDALHVPVGTAAVAVGVLGLAVVTSAWSARGSRPGWLLSPGRPSVPARVAAAGLPPVAAVGTRLALETGRGRGGVPARSALVGAAVGVAGVVAALAIGASVDHLLATPRLWGAEFDAVVSHGGDLRLSEQTAARVAGRPDVEAVAVHAAGDLMLVAGEREAVTPTTMFESRRGAIRPVLVDGRAPEGLDEVSVGAEVLQDLRLRLGDTVRVVPVSEAASNVVAARSGDVSARPATLRVVGSHLYPGAEKADNGALLSRRSYETVVGEATSASEGGALVRFAPGVDVDAAVADLRRTFHDADRVRAPSTVDNLDELGPLPYALATFLALLAVAAAAHALMSATRRRRRDLAVLRALGFVPGQVRAAVRWQAVTVAVVGLLLGAPLGLAVARQLWSTVAAGIGVLNEQAIPWLALALAVPLTLAAALLTAAAPGRAAARARPADVLRAE